jgi:hypothetical protein
MALYAAEISAGQRGRPIGVLASEGAFVPTRPEYAKGLATDRGRTRATQAWWQGARTEAQGLRFDLGDRDRIGPLRSWAQS